MKVSYFIFRILFCLSILFRISGPAELLASPSRSYEEYKRDVVPGQISKAQKHLAEQKTLVNKNIEEWAKGTKVPSNFRGNTREEIDKINKEDSTFAAMNFTSCQETRIHPHKFQNITAADRVVWHGACSEYHQYVGPSSGLCLRTITLPPFCNCYQIYTDLVEYHFPTFKVDVSDQMFRTLYLNTKEVLKTYIPRFKKLNQQYGALAVEKNIEYLSSKSSSGNTVKLPPGSKSKLNQIFRDITRYQNEHPRQAFIAPSHTIEEVRILPELINLLTIRPEPPAMRFQGLPHIPKKHYYATDATEEGFLYTHFLYFSAAMQRKWAKFMSLRGERICVQNNIATGKSFDMVDGVSHGKKSNPVDGMCLDDIGPTFTYVRNRQEADTDGTYQGVMRGMALLYDVVNFNPINLLSQWAGSPFPLQGLHAFDRAHDHWLVLRSKELRDESPMCRPIDEMAMTRISYDKANIRKAEGAAENTFEVFSIFKGCWSEKGKTEAQILGGFCGGFIRETKETLVEKGRLKIS